VLSPITPPPMTTTAAEDGTWRREAVITILREQGRWSVLPSWWATDLQHNRCSVARSL
jgi:hypothetical protein